jgi:glycosyltransferase A (GT-A) superfamily protein (DUF2064 family)
MTVVLVLAKAPVPGQAKTRLCPPATPAQAATVAAAALLDTLDAAARCGAGAVVVALTGDLADAARRTEIRAALRSTVVITQRGADFAERLVHAHADTAALFPGEAVLQIGMDTPQVGMARTGRGGYLSGAVARLDGGVRALLGPAHDGGWWALGLGDARHGEVLRTVPMSTSDTAAHTRRALRCRGLHPQDLPVLSDVDTVADAHAVAALVPGSRFATAVAGLPVGPAGERL